MSEAKTRKSRLTPEEQAIPYWIRHYQKHRDEIVAKKAQHNDCECGGRFKYSAKTQHSRTKKHQAWALSRLTNDSNELAAPHDLN